MTRSSPRFLTLEETVQLHRDAIEAYGGDPSIRDLGLVESAIAQPAASFDGEFLHPTLPEMAAVYLYHLAMNHAFVDGNKRVAAYAAGVFLDLNGIQLTCNEQVFEDLVLRVARGDANKAMVTEFFRANTCPLGTS